MREDFIGYRITLIGALFLTNLSFIDTYSMISISLRILFCTHLTQMLGKVQNPPETMIKSVVLILAQLSSTFALSSNTTSPLQHRVSCYPYSPLRVPPYPDHCLAAIGIIRNEAGFDDDRHWAPPTSHSSAVREWHYITCTVALTAKTATETDTFKPSFIDAAATRVLDRCVMQEKRDGGTTDIGPKHVFEVVVIRSDISLGHRISTSKESEILPEA